MAVYSMTGYASAQLGATAGPLDPAAETVRSGRLGLEVRSVNSRFLDLSFRLPDELRHVEPALRERVNAMLKRGKVELRLTVEGGLGAALAQPSVRLMQRLNGLQDSVFAWLPAATPLSVAEVLRLGSVEGGAQTWSDAQVLELADQVLQSLLAARAREGERLGLMLLERVAQLRALAEKAQPLIPLLVEQQRQRFLARWQEAMALTDGATLPEAARDRALTEATAFAIRIDVAEELTRLNSHFDEVERLVGKGGEIGKRLDFLIQELHREANTMGSKSAALELTHISVDMKVLIEQMREQVQNIE